MSEYWHTDVRRNWGLYLSCILVHVIYQKEKAANDKKEDKKAATKGKKGAKGKDEAKQEDTKEENHSENGDTKTNEVLNNSAYMRKWSLKLFNI